MKQNLLPCVFIADDDEDDRYLLAKAFEQHNPQCRLQFVEDGLALLDALAKNQSQPYLILLDLNMPRLNGFEALQHLRANPLYQHTPIVILTTSSSDRDRQQAQALGANELITKPLDLAKLGQVVIRLRSEWLSGCCD
ncbi:MAG: response regulator [Hymenobacter sp.]|nr:MAG: response regulator [Hymenobacter sp.]